MWREVRFLCFTQSGKRMTLLVCGKLCTYDIVRRTSTEKLYKQKHLKNTINKSKWNSKKHVQVIQWMQKNEKKNNKETSQKQKIKDLINDIPIITWI